MPCPSSHERDPAAADSPTPPLPSVALTIDAATRRLIEARAEPRWGRLLAAWQAWADLKGRYPTRTEIDPAQLGTEMLPNVFLVDILPVANAKPRYRFRLLGQAILDRETTRAGDFLDQLGASAEIAEIERHYLETIEGRISIRSTSLVWNDVRKEFLKYAVMLLPLSDGKGGVSNLIGLALYAV